MADLDDLMRDLRALARERGAELTDATVIDGDREQRNRWHRGAETPFEVSHVKRFPGGRRYPWQLGWMDQPVETIVVETDRDWRVD